MWCNHLIFKPIGSQAVRVFEAELFEEFQRIKYAVSTWFPSKGLDKIELNYITGDNNIVGPSASTNLISIDETFLSAFWNYCWGLIFAAPLGNSDKGNANKFSNPYSSLSYSHDLFFYGFSKWDLYNLPNPELRQKEIIGNINFINQVFSIGLYYIFFHEFAHIIRGDNLKVEPTKSEYHDMEFSCDKYAFDVFVASMDVEEPINMMGLLCAIGMLTYSSTFYERYTKKHPFPDLRLENLIQGFIDKTDLKKNSNFWTIATWILFTWDFMKNRVFMGAENSVLTVQEIKDGDLKDVFYKTLHRLQLKKIWG
ncbi:MAG: hypothetical protein KDE33_28180 [Bacteroidetes bacterium]|nr:hypothetical protein [Bacteroidota bacterium]